ncbi:MAG: mechanosensitive ion channel family protein, partial [Maioricimonas sp. JB049]
LLIFVIGRWVAMFLVRLLRRVLDRTRPDPMLSKFLGNVVYVLLLAVVILAALEMIGVDTTSLVAVMAAAGFAIGMALQGSLSNFAAGMMLIVFKPFREGDYVEAGGTAGVVEEIQIFHTKMRTGDNIQKIVPNGSITSGNITNYSAKPTRRIDLVIGCGYDDDLKAVKMFLENLVHGDERVLVEPAPTVAVDELGASSVNFVVRPWVKKEDYATVRWDLLEKIKVEFDERGFSFPFPSRDVYVHQAAAD